VNVDGCIFGILRGRMGVWVRSIKKDGVKIMIYEVIWRLVDMG
jgi:hypothetical protein